MYTRSPFLVRRVLAGVLVGSSVLALVVFGWLHYRVGRYHDEESAVVVAYRTSYRTCVLTQGPYAACGQKVRLQCLADRFWSEPPPFTFGLGGSLGADRSDKCTFSTG